MPEWDTVVAPSALAACFWLTTYQIAMNELCSSSRLPRKIVPTLAAELSRG